MGPAELLVGITAAVAKPAIDQLNKTVADQMLKLASSQLERWRTERGRKKLGERSKQLRRVKTLWQVEREVDLLKFYYPSKLRSCGQPAREVQRLGDLPSEGNILIRGTVGQGKSIFLRYLAARELTEGGCVPIFLELRRLTREDAIVAQAVEELKNLGLSHARQEVFEALASAGQVALLLDGFDEVDEERVGALIDELESLSARWPLLRIVATSRPDSALERSAWFRVLDLAPLAEGEYARVIERIAHSEKLAEEIVSGVRRGHESIARLLTTPLMVSLLMVHYRVGQGIPENRVAFYEPIFLVLLQRHDKFKAGYQRKRRSKLSDGELRNFFNCLCFTTRRRNAQVMKHHDLLTFGTRALHWLGHTSTPSDYAVDDIHRITCLLLKEGDEYRFLHKSIQEFHAAHFVRDQPDSVVVDFYTSLQERWLEWQQEILFLETIDNYRFNRYFAVPLIERVISTLPGATARELGLALIGRLSIRVNLRPLPEAQHPKYPVDGLGWCLVRFFDGSSELLEDVVRVALEVASQKARSGQMEHRDFVFSELLPYLGTDHKPLLDAAERLGRKLQTAFETRRERVHSIEERKGLLEL